MPFGLHEKKIVNFTEEELKGFLASHRIVIADSGTSSGRALRRFLMQFGAKNDSTVVCETYEQAKVEIAAKPTHLLISDLSLGLELINLQESAFPNRADVTTIVLGSDPSSDSLGAIAEANVDAMLIKPFNFQSFKDTLFQAFANKLHPSQYWVLLEQGKAFLKSSRFDEAEKVFESTKGLDPKPTLAFYYQAEIQIKKNNLPEAAKTLKEGLGYNPKDYRCLSSLFQIYLRTSKNREAYDLAKQIHKYYPVSTARIPDLVKLSVSVWAFGDIIDYYEIFKKLERREPLINRVVIAGMLVCAKYFFSKNDSDRGKEVLQNAAEVSLKTQLLMADVLRYFMETKQCRDGLCFFEKLPEELQHTSEVQMNYIELLNQNGDSSGVVQWGTQLLQNKVRSARLYEMVIASSIKTNRNAKSIQDLIDEAKARFPTSATLFDLAAIP